MEPPSPERVELARRIVEHEAGASPDAAALAAAVETSCRQLKDHLADLLGAGGVAALLRRALHLAQREQPLLAGASMSAEPGACFAGLAESLAASSDERAAAAATTLLTHVLDVLVMLLGEELGVKPIRKLWPQAVRGREMDR